MVYGDYDGPGRRKNKANRRALAGNPKLSTGRLTVEILNPPQDP